jgi:putative ABC transport system ATP-binding protein
VALPADYLDKKITTLSGGEKQRVALIRNLLFRPEVLLLDEVTTGLDEESKEIVHQLIARVHQEGTTIVQVTHDQEELAASKQLLHMEKGGVLK